MAGEVARIAGIEEVCRWFDRAPKEVIGPGLFRAIQAGSKIVQDEIDLRTPIRLGLDSGDITVEGGDLKGSIMTEITIDSQYRGALASVGFGRMGHVALWLEYGWRFTGHKPGKKFIKDIPPHPFMRPATDAVAERAIAAMADSLTQTIEKGVGF